jgi:hypothetical protein
MSDNPCPFSAKIDIVKIAKTATAIISQGRYSVIIASLPLFPIS